MLETVVRALQPVTTDEVGFRVLCEEAQIRWLRAPYVLKLAERGGPLPRYQDLEENGIIVGRPPSGRMLSVSHGWDSQLHVSPTGDKIKELAGMLCRLGATSDEDAVFLDYCSLSQAAPKAGLHTITTSRQTVSTRYRCAGGRRRTIVDSVFRCGRCPVCTPTRAWR